MLQKIILNLLIFGMLSAPAAGFAQGTLVPIRPPQPRPPHRWAPFYVKSQYVDVDISRQVAVTTVEQVFANPADRDQEGMYLFPVPESASITKFTMWMNGEEVEGELVEAARARHIYEDIVRRMRDPGLLEYVGRDLFRARVYPIPARGEVRIRMEYAELLRYDGGMVGYRFPMTVRCGPAPPVERMSLAVDVQSDVPVRSLYSPSHEIDARIRGRRASCGFELSNVVPGRDFVLYYTVSEEDVGLNLITHRTGDGHGYFMMLLSPGRIARHDRVLNKDIVFVLDKSGSMRGEKIGQAQRALSYCVDALNDGDRFNIVTFSTGVDAYAEGLVTASGDEKSRAGEFIKKIYARGGTDINAALLEALDMPDSERPRMVVFLTDGLPTVGETDIEAILANLRGRNEGVRIFSFGVGYDVNTTLLDRIATDRRGAVDYVKPEEDIEVKVSRFYDKVGHPVLSEIDLEVDGVRLVDVYPQRLPDLFSGSQLVVLGRYEGTGTRSIVLEGKYGGTTRRFDYEGTFESRHDDYPFIPRLWASRRIAYLMTEINTNGPERELVDAVIELSLEHGIITPFTSYLILEEGSGRDRRHARFMTPSSDAPTGSPLLLGSPKAQKLANGFSSDTGRDAFDVSSTLAEDRESAVIRDEAAGLVKFVDGVRFVHRDGEWMDPRFEPDMEPVEIQLFSDEYFDLLDKNPGIEKYLALGDKVTFVYDNQAYRITD
jgi:Ca-activated chloride channel family protein